MAILTLKNVSLTYFSLDGETEALKNINFSVEEGEFVSIVGPSGCGKTTILSLISGLMKPTSGEIIMGENQEKCCGYMFQKDHLFEWRTILSNVYLGLEIQGKKTPENMEYVNTLLKKYGLWAFKDKHPSQLSGGMRQRVALIRTMALKPKIMLLDEAFSALDYQTRLNVCDDISNILKQENVTSILVTHDINEAIAMSDKIVVLSKRPASVKSEHVIDLSKYGSPLLRRKVPDAGKYFDIIWKELQEWKTFILRNIKISFERKNKKQ